MIRCDRSGVIWASLPRKDCTRDRIINRALMLKEVEIWASRFKGLTSFWCKPEIFMKMTVLVTRISYGENGHAAIIASNSQWFTVLTRLESCKFSAALGSQIQQQLASAKEGAPTTLQVCHRRPEQ